jgi:short-subunit dehydrogenase
MEVNYFGSLTVTKSLLEPLIRDRGLIIVISSIAGLSPLYGRSGYSASKHALHGLFESLRAELDEASVEVLMVCPSFTRTPFEQRAFGAHGERVTRGRSRVGTEASPDDVAGAILDAARRRQRLLVLSPVGKLAVWLNRVAPAVYQRAMVKKLKQELAGG